MSSIQTLKKATRGKEVAERCTKIMQHVLEHLEQFPKMKLHMEEDTSWCWKVFMEEYGELNEENNQADRFAVSDLLFVTLCYLHALKEGMTPPNGVGGYVKMEHVLEVVRFLGCQHTPATMNVFPEKSLLDHLFHDIVTLVVFKLSGPLDVKEEKRLAALRSSSSSETKTFEACNIPYITDSLKQNIHELHVYALPPRNSEGKFIKQPSWGSYQSMTDVTAKFIPQCARILHGLFFQFDLIPPPPSDSDGTLLKLKNQDELRKQMQTWLFRACSVDSSDTFSQNFRNDLFASLVPVNAGLYSSTRVPSSSQASATLLPLTLLQWELGFDTASKLNDMVSLKVREIGFKPDHLFYDMMMLCMFGYNIYHELRLDFLKTFYIPEGHLLSRIQDIKKCKHGGGRPREPYIVRIQRAFYVQYYIPSSSSSSTTVGAKWYRCRDATEACLIWLHLLVTLHKGEVFTGHRMTDWSGKFLTVIKQHGNEDD